MQALEPRTRRWTKGEYSRMAALGWFEGERVELVEGEVIVATPQNFAHVAATARTSKVLETAFGQGAWVRTQMPLDLGDYSHPEPDVSMVPGGLEDYSDHPRSALLVLEVSDTTLGYDRMRKAAMYADAGIPEYWILNLVDRRLEVHRDPASGQYSKVVALTEADFASPLAAPGVRIPVGDLLGKASS
jgi:Uma2 family endonuclease